MARPAYLSDRALGRATLARQLLVARESVSPESAIRRVVGMQGQVGNAPYIGLWNRIADFTTPQLEAEIEARRMVRATAMRTTLHLLDAEDYLGLWPLMAPLVRRTLIGNWKKRIGSADIDKVAAAGRALIEDEPMTAGEIGKALASRWPETEPEALGMVVRALLPSVHVPPAGLWNRGAPPRLTTARAWLGRDPEAPMALETLVRRYLAGFGPASVMDMQAWCGLTRLGEVFERMGDALVRFTSEDGRELFDLPEAPRPDPESEVPVRLMGDYDNIGLGYDNRKRFFDPADYERISTGNGFVPAFMVDGFTAGIWRLEARGKTARITLRPFRGLGRAAGRALEAEAEAMLAGLAPGQAHAIEVSPFG